MHTTYEYHVSGMHCPSCARIMEDSAGDMPGVQDAKVDLASGTLRLLCDSQPSFAALEKIVRDAGFTLHAVQPPSA